MFFSWEDGGSCLRLGSSLWICGREWLSTGSSFPKAQRWRFTFRPVLVSLGRPGRGREGLKKCLPQSMPPSSPPPRLPFGPPEKELPSRMGTGGGQGVGIQSLRGLEGLTKLWFKSCLAVDFLSAGFGLHWMHLINVWFVNRSVICMYIFGVLNRQYNYEAKC